MTTCNNLRYVQPLSASEMISIKGGRSYACPIVAVCAIDGACYTSQEACRAACSNPDACSSDLTVEPCTRDLPENDC